MPETTTIGQRFTQLIQRLGLTKNAFALSIGKTATVIQHLVDERNKPGYELLCKVFEVYPNVSKDWLLLEQGPMLLDTTAPRPSAEPTPATPAEDVGIDLRGGGASPRRRTGNLLQPADVAATLELATQHHAGNGNSHALQPRPTGATARPLPAEVVPTTAPTPPTASGATFIPLATPGAPAGPDPAYLATLFQTQQLQHQLALAEQRNQHLLEQQELLKQMLTLLQNR